MKKNIIIVLGCLCAVPMMAQMEIRGEAIVQTASKYIGCSYKYGATGPNVFDCSGLVQYCFKQNGILLPRTSGEQARQGQQVSGSWNQLAPGDLVFFGNGNISHVGIYVKTEDSKNHTFIHASCHGVMISKLEEQYWASRYRCARRLTLATVVAIESEEQTLSAKPTQSSQPKNRGKQEKTAIASGAPSITQVGEAPIIAAVELCNAAIPHTKNWKTKVKKSNRKYVMMANG